MRRPVSALVFPVARRSNEWVYLLLKRIPMPQLGLPVFWQGVSGGVEDEESVQQAAERELFEETGFPASSVHPTGHTTAIPMQKEWRKQYTPGVTEIIEHTFVCILEGELSPALSSEHSEYAWLPFDEAHSRLHYEGNKAALEAARDWLKDNER